ncbi:hypothetical protein Q5752_001178 [Cryptotrichosporon argae]
MLFTRATFALPLLAGVIAAPFELGKRDSVVSVIDSFNSTITPTIQALADAASAGTLNETSAESYLSTIYSDLNAAASAVSGTSAKRAFATPPSPPGPPALAKRDDLDEVGAVLAAVIEELVDAIEQIADDLKAIPLIGELIIDIDVGLDTLLKGVEEVLDGVVEVLAGLLKGVSAILAGLGNGLTAALLGF